MSGPTPHALWVDAGGPEAQSGSEADKKAASERYKKLLIEHGHLIPRAPDPQTALPLMWRTGPCCERDTNGDGNCDRHLAPGVLR